MHITSGSTKPVTMTNTSELTWQPDFAAPILHFNRALPQLPTRLSSRLSSLRWHMLVPNSRYCLEHAMGDQPLPPAYPLQSNIDRILAHRVRMIHSRVVIRCDHAIRAGNCMRIVRCKPVCMHSAARQVCVITFMATGTCVHYTPSLRCVQQEFHDRQRQAPALPATQLPQVPPELGLTENFAHASQYTSFIWQRWILKQKHSSGSLSLQLVNPGVEGV